MGGSIKTERSSTGGGLLGTSGFSMGIDYQWAMTDNFSLNLFLHSSSEDFEQSTPGVTTTVGHGAFGFGGRIWPTDALFLGLHIGNYSEVIIIDTGFGSFEISGSGSGSGVVLGIEADGGFMVAIQRDQAKISYDDPFFAPTDLVTTRLHFGYRWSAN